MFSSIISQPHFQNTEDQVIKYKNQANLTNIGIMCCGITRYGMLRMIVSMSRYVSINRHNRAV